MAIGRQPLLRGTGQSDADMMGFNILNVNAVGNVQQATIHVDPLMPDDSIGARGTGAPFRTIEAALGAAEPGDTVILRPGTHAFDGTLDIAQLPGLTILGHGAIIASESDVNETIKFTINSGSVTFDGIEFDGGVTGTPSVTGNGCIEVLAPGLTVLNCFIHSQNGSAIHGVADYDGIRIFDCDIELCAHGLVLDAEDTPTRDIEGLWIKRCNFESNRGIGVSVNGPGTDSGFFMGGIQVSDNAFARNDTGDNFLPAISVTAACTRVQIHGNRILDETSGIVLLDVRNASITSNNLKGCAIYGTVLTGCIDIQFTNNIIDGRNSAGSPATDAPLVISGDFAAPNDAGKFVILGNHFVGLKNNSNAIAAANATGVMINSNRIEGPIALTALVSVMVNDNQFVIPQTTQAILINAGDRGSSKITIGTNRFNFTGASINRVITTVDASATTIDDILIIGNATPRGQVYGIATYGHSGSNLPTNVVLIGNVPEAVDVTLGWANGGFPAVDQVFVSQSYGADAGAQRESRTSKFKTINAAITAAVSGDTVIVEDGTFNERLNAKNGITVIFNPGARLRSTTTSGCIVSTADGQTFTVYHEHEAISCSQASVKAIEWHHSASYLALHASVSHTGTGTNPIALTTSNGIVEVWGFLKSSNSNAINMTGTPVVVVHGGLTGHYDIESGNSTALNCLGGEFKAENCTIFGPRAAAFNTSIATSVIFKRCTLASFDPAQEAIDIVAVGSTKPILRDCVLVSDDTATKAINVGSAQTIILYGQTVANKGADPPTNVTFAGGGTYDVNASVVID